MPDFFVSYAREDEAWAQWIAWQLEDVGYSVVVQAWDFRPGSNFVVQMQRAVTKADRTVFVLSYDSVTKAFPEAEWAAAFAADPTGLFAAVRHHFEQGLEFMSMEKGVDGDFQTIHDTKFIAEIFVDGRSRRRCKVWVGGLGDPDQIAYSSSFHSVDDDSGYNELLAIEAGPSGLVWKAFNIGFSLTRTRPATSGTCLRNA